MLRLRAEAAVEEGEVAQVAAFKVQGKVAAGMFPDECVDQGMRSAQRAAVRMVAHEDVIGPLVGKEKNAGSDQFPPVRSYAEGICLVPAFQQLIQLQEPFIIPFRSRTVGRL